MATPELNQRRREAYDFSPMTGPSRQENAEFLREFRNFQRSYGASGVEVGTQTMAGYIDRSLKAQYAILMDEVKPSP